MNESDKGSAEDASQFLTPEGWSAYRRVLTGQPVSYELPGLAEVIRYGLLMRQDASPGERPGYLPLTPDQVQQRLLGDALARLETLSSYMRGLPNFIAELAKTYHEGGGYRTASQSGGSVFLEGADVIHDAVSELMNSALHDVLTAQPGGQRPQHLLTSSLPRDLDAIRRGVRRRTLYSASQRAYSMSRTWVRTVTAEGGKVRTTHVPFNRAFIFDRRLALIDDFAEWEGPEEEKPVRAWMITNQAMVDFINAVYEQYWVQADPWTLEGDDDDSELISTKGERAVLRALCGGRTQEQAAKDLSVSKRTVTEALGSLKQKLNVQTRDQVILWWATSPDREAVD